jgi:hypothetical protein
LRGETAFDVFAETADGTLAQLSSTAYGQRSRWTSLGGRLTGRAAAVVEQGRVDVFAPGVDGGLWTRSADPAGRWVSLGGHLAMDSGPAAVSTGGTTTVVARGANDFVFLLTRHAGRWSPWQRLGIKTRSDPAVASSTHGRVDIYVRGLDDALWHGSTNYVHWQRLGGRLATGPAATAPPGGGPVTIVGLGGAARYYVATHRTDGTLSGWRLIPGVTKASWNRHVSCWATLTTIGEILGRQRSKQGGATHRGGGFRPGIPKKNAGAPPCAVNGVWEYVEIHDVRVRLAFRRGDSGDGDKVGWLADPTSALSPMTQIHGEISQRFIAAGYAPLPPPDNALIDVQGFVYWDPQHVTERWHEYSGWELHPLTAWRLAD